MNTAQLTLLLIVAATIAMFLWGRWRHDMVALGALLASVFLGVVPGASAFAGFGHPAVITVAAVLVLGYGLQITGAVDVLTQKVIPANAGTVSSILALSGLAALLSGFMNNVGALALLMPIAIQMANKQGLPPGKILMPLAFASILGGMTTLIGTPPNLIVSGFRESTGAGAFNMFDFAPVGVAVAVVGVLFIGLIGWRLVPTRKRSDTSSFESGSYMSEVRISADSKALDKQVSEVEEMIEEADAQIIAMVRREVHLSAPNPRRFVREGDILVIEVEPESLSKVLSALGAKLEDDVPSAKPEAVTGSEDDTRAEGDDESGRDGEKRAKSAIADVVIQEWVVTTTSSLIGRSSTDIKLRTRYGINLLALSRQGERTIKRLRSIAIAAGDVLLVQGPVDVLGALAVDFGCLPLAKRDIRVPRKGQALTATLLMLAAIAATASGLLPAAVAFSAGALAFVAFGVVPIRSVYDAVDWPVIVLLAAMLPVADAIGSTGTADMLARVLLDNVAQGNAVIALVIVLVVTMFLSDVMNNAATAAVMCPIGISTATQLGVGSDAFLMAIAVGASCAFLTPIGHQNNTLILGPSGFHFGDYWRLGIVVEVIVLAISVPMILWIWPL
ncbi:MAG: SLC13 family permease [Dokdonella sp.]